MRILITAGPTREALDPVRYLSNRSSGRMGYALADAAVAGGHEVVLVSGPVSLPPVAGAEVVSVESARAMYEAVRDRLPGCAIAIFCAAVADYRPRNPADQKIKKIDGIMTLELERTEDILGSARSVFGFRGFLVGFAAETNEVRIHAREKLRRKGCDLLVSNDVSRPGTGFEALENEVCLHYADGREESLPRAVKTILAEEILRRIEALLPRHDDHGTALS
ncbi:MAG: phosphopantothenoylcysteine decarboxylase [Verrucomicrobiales bacterium]